MTKQPTPGLHENFAEEAAMSTDKAIVTEPVAYIVTEALAELRKHKDASATVWSGLNSGHPFNKDATPLYAHPPSKREAGETAPAPVQHVRPLELLDPADDEAIEWVTKNLMAIRRDNGDMHYDLTAVVRAFQAGKERSNG
jgi:hypothetical protein